MSENDNDSNHSEKLPHYLKDGEMFRPAYLAADRSVHPANTEVRYPSLEAAKHAAEQIESASKMRKLAREKNYLNWAKANFFGALFMVVLFLYLSLKTNTSYYHASFISFAGLVCAFWAFWGLIMILRYTPR